MKFKHNKKRNTAFLYEVLIKEVTKAVVNKRTSQKEQTTSLLREFFHKKSLLAKELELYRALYETANIKPQTAEKLLYETKNVHVNIDQKKLYMEKSALISKINKVLTKNVYNNFVPSYKSLATISQIFNLDTPVKKRVLLEANIINNLTSETNKKEDDLQPIDNIVFGAFVKRFNEEYSDSLLEEQKVLLNNYIFSFSDNSVQLKLFLNEEIGRLKKVLQDSLTLKEFREDIDMTEKAKSVLTLIDNFKRERISEKMIKKVLNIQSLTNEILNNG